MVKKVFVNVAALEEDDDAIIKYVSSDRSDGKTTHCIRLAYDGKKQHGKVGVIARRYVNDITSLWVGSLLTNLRKVRPNAGTFHVKGSAKKDGVHIYEDGEEFAVIIPLSRAGAVKSAFDVATHRNLYIDEYVPLDGRYLADEPSKILEIWRTIDRDTFTNCVWVFSNHNTATNPLFRYFGVNPRDGISKWKNGRFVLLQCANKGNRAAVMRSPLGELVAGTPYAEYANGGTLDRVKALIHPAHQRGRLPFVVRGACGTFGFYYDADGLVIDYATPRMAEAIYLTTPTGGADGGIYLKSTVTRGIFTALQTRCFMSELYFASERVYEDAYDIWSMLSKR